MPNIEACRWPNGPRNSTCPRRPPTMTSLAPVQISSDPPVDVLRPVPVEKHLNTEVGHERPGLSRSKPSGQTTPRGDQSVAVQESGRVHKFLAGSYLSVYASAAIEQLCMCTLHH